MYCAVSFTRMFAYRPYAIMTAGMACTLLTRTATSRMAAQAVIVGHHDFSALSLAGPSSRSAGSWPRAATAASASGKLAPQRMAAGSTAKSARTASTWKLIHGLVVAEGLSGQYGSDCVSV